jgi:hypothetical protein
MSQHSVNSFSSLDLATRRIPVKRNQFDRFFAPLADRADGSLPHQARIFVRSVITCTSGSVPDFRSATVPTRQIIFGLRNGGLNVGILLHLTGGKADILQQLYRLELRINWTRAVMRSISARNCMPAINPSPVVP